MPFNFTRRILVRPGRSAAETAIHDHAFGRPYSGAPGAPLDVPQADARHLCANGWIDVALSGPSTGRPTPCVIGGPDPYGFGIGAGFKFFDTTLNDIIVFDGFVWRSPINGAAV